jgi:hypothetical protein
MNSLLDGKMQGNLRETGLRRHPRGEIFPRNQADAAQFPL